MEIDEKKGSIGTLDWVIPLWFKIGATAFSLGWVGVLVRALSIKQPLLLGLTRDDVIVLASTVSVLSVSFAIVFWFYHTSLLPRLFYWMLRTLRIHVCVLSLLGILYLFTIRAPVFSLRGGVLYLVLLSIFSAGFLVKPAGLDDIPHPALTKIFNSVKRMIFFIGSGSPFLWKCIAVILPGTIVLLVIYLVIGARLSNYGPFSFWNDEVAYWIWLRSFSFTGFHSGYNAPNELLPLLEFSRYGEASPFYIYIYGSIARLTGWFTTLPVFINLFIITLAIFLFVRFVKLDAWQVVFVCLSIAFTWPVLLYLPLTTHETLNQAFGIVFSIMFIRLISDQRKVSLKLKYVFLLVLYFATFVRLSWGLLLIPALFYCIDSSLIRRGVFSVIIGCVMYISVIVVMGALLPPINNSILDMFKDSVVNGHQVFTEKLQRQIFQMFKFKEFNPNIGVSFQMVIVMAWDAVGSIRLLRSKLSPVSIINDFNFFDLYNMASLFVAGFLFYLQEGFYRTFAPAMLIVYLLQVFRKNYKKLSVLLMINVIFFSSYMNFYAHVGDFHIIESDYTREVPQSPEIQAEIGKLIVYDPDASDPWCNTLLIPLGFYDSRLMLIPPGIGISYILQPSTFSFPIKSRYVMFDLETYDVYKEYTDLQQLASLPLGELYINLDATCPSVR